MNGFKRNNGDVSKMMEWFSTIIPQRTESVTICAWTRVPSWESRSPAEYQQSTEAKKPRAEAMNRVRGTVSICRVSVYTRQHYSVPVKLAQPTMSSAYKAEGEGAPGFPSHAGHCPRSPLPPCSTQNTEVICS